MLAFALQSFAFLFAFLKAQGTYHLWQSWFSDLQGRSKSSPVIFCLVYQHDFYKGLPQATEDCSLGLTPPPSPPLAQADSALWEGSCRPLPRCLPSQHGCLAQLLLWNKRCQHQDLDLSEVYKSPSVLIWLPDGLGCQPVSSSIQQTPCSLTSHSDSDSVLLSLASTSPFQTNRWSINCLNSHWWNRHWQRLRGCQGHSVCCAGDARCPEEPPRCLWAGMPPRKGCLRLGS